MASIVKRIRNKAKDYGRRTLAVGAKVSRVARPLAAAAAGYFAGPIGSAAVTAASHYGQQYQEASGARGRGIRGRDAREIGRKAAQRTTKHSLMAGGVGSLASGVTSALSGGNFFGGAAAGQGGSALLGGNTIFGSTTAGSLLAAGEGGAVSLAGVKSGWDGLQQMDASAGAANVDTPGTDWESIASALAAGAAGGLGGGSGSDSEGDPDQTETRRRLGIPTVDSPNGGGGDGEKPAWLIPALLGVGALVLFA